MDPDRKLVVGRELSTWPQAKLVRAQAHAAAVGTLIDAWIVGRPLLAEGRRASDDRGIEFYLKIASPPPVQQLSLIVGDCVHALRSSLDAAIWEVAHLDGRHPTREKTIQFPVVYSRKKWDEVSRTLDVDELFLARITKLQPFMTPSDEIALLKVLHDLDILDKHKSSIVAHPLPLRFETSSMVYLEAGQSIWMEQGNAQGLEDGVYLGAIRLDSALQRNDTVTDGIVDVSFEVQFDDAWTFELSMLLNSLISGTGSILRMIYGIEEPGTLGFARVPPNAPAA